MSSTPASTAGWLATMPTLHPAEMREAADDVAGVVGLHLVELAVVDHAADDVVHVVRLVRIVGHDVEQRLVAPVARDRSRGRAADRRGCSTG